MKSIILVLIVSIVVVYGCSSQTTVKFQCADGFFVDSANSCSSVNYKTNCPELDCVNCPAKIEYKDREVKKEVYINKPIYKYQCFDGTSADSITGCKYTDTSLINKVGDCENNKELRKMDIWFNDQENMRNFDVFNVPNVWYPGENEGKIFGTPLFLKNTGCKKIEPSINMYLYDGTRLFYTTENRKISPNSYWRTNEQDVFYPNDWVFTYAFLIDGDYEIERNGLKINSLGEYRLRVIVKDVLSEEIVGSKEIQLTIKST